MLSRPTLFTSSGYCLPRYFTVSLPHYVDCERCFYRLWVVPRRSVPHGPSGYHMGRNERSGANRPRDRFGRSVRIDHRQSAFLLGSTWLHTHRNCRGRKLADACALERLVSCWRSCIRFPDIIPARAFDGERRDSLESDSSGPLPWEEKDVRTGNE